MTRREFSDFLGSLPWVAAVVIACGLALWQWERWL